MNLKRIGRALVCLLVICCLIVNISPIRARATSVLIGAAVTVLATYAISSVLIGLGVSAHEETTTFDNLVDSIANHLDSIGLISNGVVKVLSYAAGGAAGQKFMIDQSFIESVQSYLYAEDVLQSTDVPSGYAIYNGVQLPLISNYKASSGGYGPLKYVVMCWNNVGEFYEIWTWDTAPTFDGTKFTSEKQYCHRLYAPGSQWEFIDRTLSAAYSAGTAWEFFWANWDVKDSSGNVVIPYVEPITGSSITTDQDLSLGVVNKELSGYNIWAEGALSVPGSQVGSEEEEVTYWPIGLGDSYDDTSKLTQEDIWAGKSTYEDTSNALTGTFADTTVGSFLVALLDVLMIPFEWLLDGIKAIFVPSEDYLTSKVDALMDEFRFIGDAISSGRFFLDALDGIGNEPPIVYIELDDAESDYDWGVRAVALDLRWYERYKPVVDKLLSAVFWALFVWRTLVKLPGIIGGMPGDFVMDSMQRVGLAGRLPSRKAAYQVQRQSLRQSIRKGPGK